MRTGWIAAAVLLALAAWAAAPDFDGAEPPSALPSTPPAAVPPRDSAAPARARRPSDPGTKPATAAVDDEHVLGWSGTVELSVVAADTRGAIPGAEVLIRNLSGRSTRSGTTDADGRVVLPRPRAYGRVAVRAVGFVTTAAELPAEGEFEIGMRRGFPVRGRVVHASDGRPVADAEVFAWDDATGSALDPPLASTGEGSAPVGTDADGRFEIAAAHAGRTATLAVRAPGYGVAVARVGPVAPDGEVVVRLGDGATLAGTVLDADGAPMDGVPVRVVEAGEPPEQGSAEAWLLAPGRPRVVPSTVTDGEGRFAVSGLPVPARYSAVAVSGARRALGAGVTLADRDARAEQTLQFHDAATVRGRAVAPDGSGVEVERVAMVDDDGRVTSRPVERVGDLSEWPWQFVPPGRWTLVVVPRGPWRTARVPLDLASGDDREVVVRLVPGALLVGSVADEDGRPVAGALVSGPDGRTATADANGVFRFEGLDAGAPADVEVVDPSGRCAPARREDLVPGGPPVRVVLRAAAAVVGRADVRDLNAIVAVAADERLHHLVVEDGRFRLGGVPEGVPFDVDLFAWGRPGRYVRRGLVARAGETLDLGEVDWPEPRPVLGTVRDDAGRPVPAARVSARGGTDVAFAGADGRFSVALEAGDDDPVVLAFAADGFATAFAEPVPGEPVDVVLSRGFELRGELHGGPDAVARRELRFLPLRDEGGADRARQHAAATDSLGRFVVRLPPGAYEVWTWSAGGPWVPGPTPDEAMTRLRDRLVHRLGRVDAVPGAAPVVLRLP